MPVSCEFVGDDSWKIAGQFGEARLDEVCKFCDCGLWMERIWGFKGSGVKL